MNVNRIKNKKWEAIFPWLDFAENQIFDGASSNITMSHIVGYTSYMPNMNTYFITCQIYVWGDENVNRFWRKFDQATIHRNIR